MDIVETIEASWPKLETEIIRSSLAALSVYGFWDRIIAVEREELISKWAKSPEHDIANRVKELGDRTRIYAIMDEAGKQILQPKLDV